MTGGAAWGDGDHVVLHRGRRGRMVEGVLGAVAVGAVLLQPGPAIEDGGLDLRSVAGVAFDASVLGAAA